ncbi:MAG: ribulose-phosphate 3-epimerase [Acidobacteria bacterium 13_1_40CM_3_55_6]|nr:MAG: ribulose-phosphate 3-epimerase [Acidobacteria bacterium 13_1_40CM_3_55_6]PYS63288.1 MAG: ribulose-phosphate 3-epimerase [Acidobacteriota bacterium]
MIEIAPSILSADFSRLGEQIKTVERAGASLLHVDVMDGRFVPNITVGLPVVKAISRATQLPIDVHLMIVEPARYVESFVEAGAQMVSIHIEADPHAHRTLTALRAAGAQAGIAINPATSLSALEEAIRFVDFVLVMSVNPGFGGQEFISSSLDKVRRLRKMLDERGSKARIEIDGGIDQDNVAEVAGAGAEIIVSGSAIFGAPDPAVALRELREATVLWV